jgi:uncharacterized protein (UPF0264 family)
VIVEQLIRRRRPGLLVSVRGATEALAALAGGADVIDVKEPDRGALGAADWEIIAQVVEAVEGRAPVTAAAGELMELLPVIKSGKCRPLPDGISLLKIGLAGCVSLQNWVYHWQAAIGALRGRDREFPQPVAVVYADWRLADAPPPAEIQSAAVQLGCRVVLVDTWDKSAGSLFDHWPLRGLREFIELANISGSAVVLAGSLSDRNLLAAAELRPSLVAVRGAVCEAGRTSTISQQRVVALSQALRVDELAVSPSE